jgi:SAM-dependent methyltransferase
VNLTTLDDLLQPLGQSALEMARDLSPTEAKYPAYLDRLRKRFPDSLARAALDTILLRIRATRKFSKAEAMYFDRESLEMASGEVVARYRAERFAPYRIVADLCCGIGGDAIGLALAGRAVVAVDTDAVRVRMAQANVAAYGQSGEFVSGDVRTVPLPEAEAAFADPGRRAGGKRRLAIEDYEPSVSSLRSRFPPSWPMGIKVAPGIDRQELDHLDAEAEFISVEGELKECVLWFGPLRSGATQATVLPGPYSLNGNPAIRAEIAPIRDYLYDPDPAITRAGLVGTLAERLGATQFDPLIAFLSSNRLVPTPFATAYRVDAVLPFHARRIGEWLRQADIGRVTLVKRGTAIDTEPLQKRWKLTGSMHRTVLLTRLGDQPLAIIAERIES